MRIETKKNMRSPKSIQCLSMAARLCLAVFLLPVLLLAEHRTGDPTPSKSRTTNKYRRCFCVFHANPANKSYLCSLAGRDSFNDRSGEWEKAPKGIFAQTEVKTMGACRSWCDHEFENKKDLYCSYSQLSLTSTGVPVEERTQLQMEACRQQGIELPPRPFSKGWIQLKDDAGNTVIPESDLWVKTGDAALWKWVSASASTTCVGMRRFDPKDLPSNNATGIICWAKNGAGECPTCFFDTPQSAPSPDGKTLGDELHAYRHHQTIDSSPGEVCTACHANKSNPLLFSPRMKSFLPKSPDCKSFAAVGFEMHRPPVIERRLTNNKALESCAACHPGWEKEFNISSPYAMTVLRQALKKDKHGTPYMPMGGTDKEDEAVRLLNEMVDEIRSNVLGR